MTSPVPPPHQAHSFARRFALLAASSMTVMAGATISPSLPEIRAHFADLPDVDLLTRLVLTMPAIFIALCAPVAGAVVDRFGRKRLLLASVLLYVAAGSSGLWLDTLPQFLIGRALLGVAVAGVMTAATTLIGDYFSGPERERFMGLQAAFMGYGGVLFLTFGGLLADFHWRGAFLIYLVPLALLPVIALAVGEPKTDIRRPDDAPAPDHLPIGVIALVYAIAVFNSVLFYFVPVQLPFFLRSVGIEGASLAGISAACGILVAATVPLFFQALRRRFSPPALFALSFIVMGAGYGLLGQATSLPQVLAAMVLTGLGMGPIMANMSVWLMSVTPPSHRGRVIGGLTTGIFVGQFLSPMASQPLVDHVGLAGMYEVGGAVLGGAGLAFAVYALIWRWQKAP